MPTYIENISTPIVSVWRGCTNAAGAQSILVSQVAHSTDSRRIVVEHECDSEAEWEALDAQAMSSDRIDAIAEFLRSTGQASA